MFDFNRLDDLCDVGLPEQRVVNAELALILVEAEPGCRIALRVEIDQQDLLRLLA